MNNITERLTSEGVQVKGTFNVQIFYDTIARILSQRENMDITVKVISDKEQEPPKDSLEMALPCSEGVQKYENISIL